MGEFIWQRDDWPQFRWSAETLLVPLGAARSAQGALLARGDQLSLLDQRDLYVEEAYATSGIEGESLDRERLRSSVAERLGLPTAGLPRSDVRSDSLVEVMLDATQNAAHPLTQERIQGWQAALFPTGYSGPSEGLNTECRRWERITAYMISTEWRHKVSIRGKHFKTG